MVVFVGGGGAYNQYYKNPDYLELAKKAKSIAAICIAPTLLSDSGLFVGKQVTGRDDGFWTQITYLKNQGAIYKDQPVVQDWNLITANGPQAAPQFARMITDYLQEGKSAF